MALKSYDSRCCVLIIGGDFHGLGIARNLARVRIPVTVVSPGFGISKYSRFVHEYYRCPPWTDTEPFTEFLMELAAQKGWRKTVIFPTNDTAVRLLSNHRERLRKHYLIPTPAWDITQITYDKKLTHEVADRIGVPSPATFFPESEKELPKLKLRYPVILKPCITANFVPVAKVKAIRADNIEELCRSYEYVASIIKKSEIMIQEVIGGGPKNLYSFCSLFAKGKALAKLMARRQRQHPMDFGTATTYAYTCNIPELEEMATRLLREIDYTGLSEVEFMYDERDRAYKLLEINARTWAWHTLGAKAGVNFSELLFRYMHDEPVYLDSFEQGVKWIREVTDVPIVLTEMLKRRLKLKDYLQTLRGKKQLAVFSPDDPLPFVADLLSAPYFFYKRGYRI